MDPAFIIFLMVAVIAAFVWGLQQHNVADKKKEELEKTQADLQKHIGEKEELQSEVRLLKGEIQKLSGEIQAKNQKIIEAELETLNYELSPHAFKNTMNSIKGMAFRLNSATDHFTELLNYMLYETKQKSVPLLDEIEFLKKYIALNQLMLPSNVKIQLKVDHMDTEFQKGLGIAPLMTVYYAENAFKHCNSHDSGCNIVFQVKKVGDNKIRYTVTNTFQPQAYRKPQSGIGSSNMAKRLRLLYEDRFEAESFVVGDEFVSMLTLSLAPYEDQVPTGR